MNMSVRDTGHNVRQVNVKCTQGSNCQTGSRKTSSYSQEQQPGFLVSIHLQKLLLSGNALQYQLTTPLAAPEDA